RDAAACAKVADLYIHGKGGDGRPNKVKAVAAYERGCDAGDVGACNAGGQAFFRRDRAKAAQLRQNACDLGSGEGLFTGAAIRRDQESVAGAKEKADAAEQRGVEIFTKGCQAGDPEACFGLGAFKQREDESVGQKYYREAMQIWQKRCDTGDVYACHRLGV